MKPNDAKLYGNLPFLIGSIVGGNIYHWSQEGTSVEYKFQCRSYAPDSNSFHYNGAEITLISVNSANSGNLINH